MKHFFCGFILLSVILNGTAFPRESYAASFKKQPLKSARQGEYEINGLVFGVPAAMVYTDTQTDMPKNFLAVTFRFTNSNDTKKVDIAQDFVFGVKDEHGNVYRRCDVPQSFAGPVEIRNKNFPSIYPQEHYQEVIFFEAPIAKSRVLTFTVNARNIGVSKEIVLSLPAEKIENFSLLLPKSEQPMEKPQLKETAQSPVSVGPLRIVSPKSGMKVSPGQTVQIDVEVPSNTPAPDKIFVVISTYTLTDDKVVYHYDVTIPRNEKGTFSVVVIGQWQRGGAQEEILSDTIVLNVVPTPQEAN